jgi:nitrous oxidase accessory protein
LKPLLAILSFFFFTSVSGKTITVGKDQVITNLKEAVAIAGNGDTILLTKGIYKEGNIVITKSIILIGVNQPVLDGENKYEILTVSGSDIIIKGIHFRNTGNSGMNDIAAINLLNATYTIIENNIIDQAFFAIHLANVTRSIIRNNQISGARKTEQTSGNGIHLWKCDSIVVTDNDITGHRDGIYFEFVTNSFINSNYSHNNIRYGLHFMFSNNDAYVENIFRENGSGVAVMYSHHVTMLQNQFDFNWGSNAYGLLLKEISDGMISGNIFTKNTVGIMMESTNRMHVFQNDLSDNGWALRIQASCDANTVAYNNFRGNTFDVATNGSLQLNEFYRNYWDKYEGYDLNKDRIGDLPYHPVSLYSMVIEQNPNSLLLLRSFMVSLLDKAEKALPSLTPENLVDAQPLMKKYER